MAVPGLSLVVEKEEDWPRTITDVNGYSVTLAGPSVRSAPLPPPLGTFAVAISGGIERIATVHPFSKSVMKAGSLNHYFPGVANLSTAAIDSGFIPNVEELLVVNPDLVFQVGFVGEEMLFQKFFVSKPINNRKAMTATSTIESKASNRFWPARLLWLLALLSLMTLALHRG